MDTMGSAYASGSSITSLISNYLSIPDYEDKIPKSTKFKDIPSFSEYKKNVYIIDDIKKRADYFSLEPEKIEKSEKKIKKEIYEINSTLSIYDLLKNADKVIVDRAKDIIKKAPDFLGSPLTAPQRNN